MNCRRRAGLFHLIALSYININKRLCGTAASEKKQGYENYQRKRPHISSLSRAGW